MEIDTAALSARRHLDRLRAELAQCGWTPESRGTREKPYLRGVSPDDAGLNGTVATLDVYRWTRGAVLGSLDDAAGVADLIVHTLRGVRA